ncbi:hypothetical protein [Nioella aestuarii]
MERSLGYQDGKSPEPKTGVLTSTNRDPTQEAVQMTACLIPDQRLDVTVI